MRITKEGLPVFAKNILKHLKNIPRNTATTVALSGDLGAGKTALVQEIAKNLLVGQIPPSPTFVIMRSYKTGDSRFKKLVHIDAYRIESEDELRPLHLEEVFAEEGTLVCIEWPEKMQIALPKETLQITLISEGEREREVEVTGALARGFTESL